MDLLDDVSRDSPKRPRSLELRQRHRLERHLPVTVAVVTCEEKVSFVLPPLLEVLAGIGSEDHRPEPPALLGVPQGAEHPGIVPAQAVEELVESTDDQEQRILR